MKKGIKSILCAVAVSAAALPGWSNNNDASEDMRTIVSISREDVVNKTGNRAVDLNTLIDHLSNDLLATGLYRVMGMEDILKVVRKADQMSVVADGDDGGTKITAPGFFIGLTITVYGLTAVGAQNAVMGAAVITEAARIELILKIVDARTGETIKSKCLEGSATGQVIAESSSLRGQLLQSAMKEVREKIVYELIKLTPFGVLDVENGVVSLDVPGSLKIMGKPVQPGTQFVVSKLGKGKKSKRTGKVTRSEKQVAVVCVTTVGEDSCSAQILSGAITPIGDDEDTQYDPYIVKINEGSAATPVPAAAAPAADNGAAPF